MAKIGILQLLEKKTKPLKRKKNLAFPTLNFGLWSLLFDDAKRQLSVRNNSLLFYVTTL